MRRRFMLPEAWKREIHRRLVGADPAAPGEFASAVWEPLVRGLEKRHPRLRDSEFLRDAASDAIIDFVENPTRFDSARQDLLRFLFMAADADLRNALAKAARRKRWERLLQTTYELRSTEETTGHAAPDLDDRLGVKRTRAWIAKLFADPRDRKTAELVIEGERSTAAFAKVWGLADLSRNEQARQVKRHKDRIKKTLARRGGRAFG